MLSVEAEVREAGMDDYVSKPFNPRDLYRKIAKNIDEAGVVQQDVILNKSIL
jgi:DNA-binding response OmpR family regulator